LLLRVFPFPSPGSSLELLDGVVGVEVLLCKGFNKSLKMRMGVNFGFGGGLLQVLFVNVLFEKVGWLVWCVNSDLIGVISAHWSLLCGCEWLPFPSSPLLTYSLG
jgi:hypothetical protein